MNLLFVDFETFYDTSAKYDLKLLSTVEYVRDPRFKVYGLGFARGDDAPQWKVSGLGLIVASDTVIVAHNCKFDGFILAEKFGINPARWIDTQAMARAVLGKTVKSHSLAALAEHYGLPSKGVMKANGLRDLTPAQEVELAEYCKHDVWLCREIYKRLAPLFPESQYAPMDQTIRMFVNPKLTLNVRILQEAEENERERRKIIFAKLGIPKSEFASNKKFPALLAARNFIVPSKLSPRSGKEIPALALGDPEFLDMLRSGNDELRTLCEARVAAKSTLLETRSAALARLARTGLWPFDVHFSGATQTHRYSGGGGAGGNPQNFTRGSALREAVEAPDGYSLVVGDFSNVELRIVAYLSADRGLVQAIETGRDLYCDFASAFFGRRITKADKSERHFGKCAILGLGYGMGAKKFERTVFLQTGRKITREEAQKAVDLYRTLYRGVPALWEKLHGEIRPGYQQILPSGLKVQYTNLRQEKGERGNLEWVYDAWDKNQLTKKRLYGGKVLENKAQSLAGELCKSAMLAMGGLVVGQVHDELLCVCRRGCEQVTRAKLLRVMSTPPAWLPQMKLAAEVKLGKNWLQCK